MAVISFAHLKKGTAQQPSIEPPPPTSGKAPAVIEAPFIPLQRIVGIGNMKTALLASVNYCADCPRFWLSDENEKERGIPHP